MYLETQRLIVRRMEDADFPHWCSYATDSRLCRMMDTPILSTLEDARQAFDWLLAHEKRFYAIVLREEMKCVGHLIVYNYPDIGDLPELQGKTGRSLSFAVSGAYRRRGIAAEALTATIDYLFDRRGVDYIISSYYTFNEPSRRLHEKLGFKPLAGNDPAGESTVKAILFPGAPGKLPPRGE